MAYKALWWLVEWANYTRPKFEEPRETRKKWTVDVLTTACPGEPRGMILRTLLAMKAIRYPHTDYLCDEGNDPALRKACELLGVRHITRSVKKDAKAGNINNALEQATGDIAVVLDPDHEPAPYMLDRVLGYFDDPSVGFVQSVQAYRNQKDSLVADGAAKQTYLFYGPVMIGMNAYGTTQAIGANCVFRRSALDSIDGHSAGLAEDMHTTLRLYSRGWRSVYIPEVLTRGLVPSTLSAYCKQQLKWACGSLELLLSVYPKLFRQLTGWQRLHYLVAPLYFLRGLFGAVNILVPIVCLTLGGIALRINLLDYLAAYVPVVMLAAIIRQQTQRWTIESSERGAHLMGGILGTGCWDAFLRGSLCAIFRIKLPYIPTPKDNEAHDSWGLAMPNLIAAGLSVAAVIYGLNRDWTPYSLMMAAFALWNAAQLAFVAALGQQRTLQRIAYFFARRDWVSWLISPLERMRFRLHTGTLALMREHPAILSLLVMIAAVLIGFRPPGKVSSLTKGPDFKDTGGFYFGAETGTAQALGIAPRLSPLDLPWGPEETHPLPLNTLAQARRNGAVPLLTWKPTFSTFRSDPGIKSTDDERRVFSAISEGTFDKYLISSATQFREFGEPVLIRFAPHADNPNEPWGAAGAGPGSEFRGAWSHVAGIFSSVGASNVGWVWEPSTPDAFRTHLPDKNQTDWIAIHTSDTARSFEDNYAPFRAKLRELRLPVMITALGSPEPSKTPVTWISAAVKSIAETNPEIRGALMPEMLRVADGTAAALVANLKHPAFRGAPEPSVQTDPSQLWSERPRDRDRSPAIQGAPGQFELRVNGEPFYIRGMAYNPGHDWRDGFVPLTRRELEEDFERVRATGANTIRRYGSSWYDRNVLKVAAEKDLKVLFGFWFEHHVDYRADTQKLKAYAEQVESTEKARRDEPAVLAWSLGNEVWGLLKHHYAQPYLTEVRHAHIDFVEQLARRVHQLDPERPVFVAHEHSPHLAGTLSDFGRGAPSVDFTAVNSYYEQRISKLSHLAAVMDPSRPYLVAEFGPDGYWESQPGQRSSLGALLEPDSEEKVRSYQRGWAVHTEPHRGSNIGGVAYCWRDRYEATATWFGLTDDKGRLKPAGLALQKLWTGKQTAGPRVIALEGPAGPVLPGSQVTLNAKVQSVPNEKKSYKWRLASEDFNFKVGKIEAGRFIAPKKPGTYRVYFSIANGNTVDEANIPIVVVNEPGAGTNLPLDDEAIFSRRQLVGP